jgi:hypothetical protein
MQRRESEIGSGQIGAREIAPLKLGFVQIAARTIHGSAGDEIVALIRGRWHRENRKQGRRSKNSG